MPKKTPLGGMRASTNGEPSPRCTGNALTISASRPTRLFRSSRCLKRRIITSRSDEKGDVRRMTQTPGEPPSPAKPVSAGQDQFGEHRGLGVSRVDFKVAGQGRDGLLVLENTFHTKGGPARHLHVAQELQHPVRRVAHVPGRSRRRGRHRNHRRELHLVDQHRRADDHGPELADLLGRVQGLAREHPTATW